MLICLIASLALNMYLVIMLRLWWAKNRRVWRAMQEQFLASSAHAQDVITQQVATHSHSTLADCLRHYALFDNPYRRFYRGPH